MIETLYLKTCQYAKRQMTWYRRMERQGISIEWIQPDHIDDLIAAIKMEFL